PAVTLPRRGERLDDSGAATGEEGKEEGGDVGDAHGPAREQESIPHGRRRIARRYELLFGLHGRGVHREAHQGTRRTVTVTRNVTALPVTLRTLVALGMDTTAS